MRSRFKRWPVPDGDPWGGGWTHALMASLLVVDVDPLAISAPQWFSLSSLIVASTRLSKMVDDLFPTVSLRSLCFLDSWLPWKTSSGSRPVKGMEGDGDGRVGINVEMQTLFPTEGMLPCNHVLIGWLHQLPSEEQPSPSFSLSQNSGRLGTRGTITNTYRANLCMRADGDSVPELIRDMQHKV